jgi:hypothetical protein
MPIFSHKLAFSPQQKKKKKRKNSSLFFLVNILGSFTIPEFSRIIAKKDHRYKHATFKDVRLVIKVTCHAVTERNL